eukprot:882745-Rhodomonas_salina.1
MMQSTHTHNLPPAAEQSAEDVEQRRGENRGDRGEQRACEEGKGERGGRDEQREKEEEEEEEKRRMGSVRELKG